MIRKKVLSIGSNTATLLVQDTEANGALCVLRRVNVSGWTDGQVSAAVQMYRELQRRRLRGFVPIHTVLIQGTFLSVVASYALEGDVTSLIDEESGNSFEEASVLRWLCACALAIRQLHAHGLFFPGLTTDRLLLDHQTGGTANLLLGVPLPLPIYYAQFCERKKNGVRVELDYPPEVIAAAVAQPVHSNGDASNNTIDGGGYHPTLSDVWCLGRLGVVLFTAKGSALAQRSGGARQLLSRMMANEPATRPSMESVVESLLALAGKVSLGQPPWPSTPVTDPPTAGVNSASVGSARSAPGREPPGAEPVGSGGGAVTSGKTAAVGSRSVGDGGPEVESRFTAAVHASAAGGAPSNSTTSPRRGAVSTRAHDRRHSSAVTPLARAHVSPPPRMRESASHLNPTVRPRHAPDDSWYRRTGEKIEMLQQMNASPLRQHALNGGGEARPCTSFSEHGHHRLRGSASGPSHAKAPSPRRNGRGVPIDHNTRVLDEMFAGQREIRRQAEGWHPLQQPLGEDGKQLQRETLRHLRLETAVRQQEMRKHFTEWQRQNNQRLTDSNNVEVIDHDGIVIVAPRPAPPPVSPPTSRAEAAADCTEINAEAQPPKSRPQPVERLQGEAARYKTPMSASSPQPNSASRLATPLAKTPAVSGTPVVAASEPSARFSGNTPQASCPSASTQGVNDTSGPEISVLPSRSAVSPRQLRTPKLNTVKPYPSKSSEISRLPTTSSNDDDDDEQQPLGSARSGGVALRKCSTDASTLSAVEWSIDGIRSALRKLLRNRDLYGDIMQEVALFISQSEEARLAVHSNEIFMRRLHQLLRNDALLFGAAPLCAQLVALEGLDHTLRGTLGSRPSR
ncbi:hypothetical protein JKF63_03589 [Porcisia hertigi]|uniref:non-specific serine/threonine protein kinase n=1 Tax=Porcisia hertigi TaxID=2761500 RepID=A0A836L9R6_9TRYP|nr:hypothetical protein JKF63_03589 [Porcisia hertigi]